MKRKILAVALSTLLVCSMTAALYACGDGEKSYTVTYTASKQGVRGELPTDNTKYKEGDKVTLQSGNSLTLEGYHFMGWNDGTTTYKVSAEYTMPAKKVTFTAVWEKDGFTVSYMNTRGDRGSLIVLDNQYQEGDKITLMAKPDTYTDANGREFAGWYSLKINGDDVEEIDYEVGEEFTIPARNVEFFAHWKATSITATFYTEQGLKGTVYDTKTYPIGANGEVTIVLPEEPTREGYEFAGWFRCDNEDIEFTAQTEFTGNMREEGAIALFAKWAPVQG